MPKNAFKKRGSSMPMCLIMNNDCVVALSQYWSEVFQDKSDTEALPLTGSPARLRRSDLGREESSM